MGDELDADVARLVAAGELDKAATQLMEAYGSEIYGFLVNLMSSDTAASDVFSQFAEGRWAGLPKSKFKSTTRTWLYGLSRHAAARDRRTPWNKKDRRGGESRIQSPADVARSRTQPWERTEIK